VKGWVLPQPVNEAFAESKQADVALLETTNAVLYTEMKRSGSMWRTRDSAISRHSDIEDRSLSNLQARLDERRERVDLIDTPLASAYPPRIMRQALGQLLLDLLSALTFVVLFALTGNLLFATVGAITIAVVQTGLAIARKRAVSPMQWLALGLAVGLALLTLVTSDSRFVRIKPSIAHVAVGVVMLKRGWLIPYLPPRARDRPDPQSTEARISHAPGHPSYRHLYAGWGTRLAEERCQRGRRAAHERAHHPQSRWQT
jgi:hypothetical protein